MYQPYFKSLGVEYCQTSLVPASLQLAFWIGRWLIDISRGSTLSMAGVMQRTLRQETGTHGGLTVVRVSLRRCHIRLMLLGKWLLQQSWPIDTFHFACRFSCVCLWLQFSLASLLSLTLQLPSQYHVAKQSWITPQKVVVNLASALGWHSELWHTGRVCHGSSF